jgi:hypothetical protein
MRLGDLNNWRMTVPPIIGAAIALFLIVRAMWPGVYHNAMGAADINSAVSVGVMVTGGLYTVLFMKPPGKEYEDEPGEPEEPGDE